VAQTEVAVGAQAPVFGAVDENGRQWHLDEALERSPRVLIFYRGDWWPYCNGQLVSYARKHEEFQKRGAEIIAICVDTPEQNKAMIDKLLLPLHILSDPEGERAIKPYGV
jgi:peroxiredoxin